MTTLDLAPRTTAAVPAAVAGPASHAPVPDLQASAADAAALLKALAHPDRLLLLCQLLDTELSVTELGARVGLGQPSLSQQLAVLRAEQLVATRREGKQIYYRVASPAAQALLQTLQALFCAPDIADTPDRPHSATAARPAPPASRHLRQRLVAATPRPKDSSA